MSKRNIYDSRYRSYEQDAVNALLIELREASAERREYE